MNRNKFNNEVSKLATCEQARQRYKLSRGLLMNLAESAGAIRRISARCIRIDVNVLDDYLDQL